MQLTRHCVRSVSNAGLPTPTESNSLGLCGSEFEVKKRRNFIAARFLPPALLTKSSTICCFYVHFGQMKISRLRKCQWGFGAYKRSHYLQPVRLPVGNYEVIQLCKLFVKGNLAYLRLNVIISDRCKVRKVFSNKYSYLGIVVRTCINFRIIQRIYIHQRINININIAKCKSFSIENAPHHQQHRNPICEQIKRDPLQCNREQRFAVKALRQLRESHVFLFAAVAEANRQSRFKIFKFLASIQSAAAVCIQYMVVNGSSRSGRNCTFRARSSMMKAPSTWLHTHRGAKKTFTSQQPLPVFPSSLFCSTWIFLCNSAEQRQFEGKALLALFQ